MTPQPYGFNEFARLAGDLIEVFMTRGGSIQGSLAEVDALGVCLKHTIENEPVFIPWTSIQYIQRQGLPYGVPEMGAHLHLRMERSPFNITSDSKESVR